MVEQMGKDDRKALDSTYISREGLTASPFVEIDANLLTSPAFG